MKNRIWNSCLDFITKDIWRLNPPELNRLGHCLGKYSRSITRIVQNQKYLWTQGNAANDSLTQGTTDRALKEYFKWLNAYVVAKGGHFYYSR